MVDFCLTIHSSTWQADDAVMAAFNAQLQRLPDATINHTEFLPLVNNPICISIETKTSEAGTEHSHMKVQVGIWQAAQWKLLSQLVRQNILSNVDEHARSAELEEKVVQSLAKLPFLPAVVITGHNWSFVATTRNSPQTASLLLPHLISCYVNIANQSCVR